MEIRAPPGEHLPARTSGRCIGVRAQCDLARLAREYAARRAAFVNGQRQGRAGRVALPPLGSRRALTPHLRELRARECLHFAAGRPRLLDDPRNSDLATSLSRVEGSELKTFGNNLREDELAAACELARRQKERWTQRVAARSASYYKVSEDWARRNGVDPAQMNSPPRPLQRRRRAVSAQRATVDAAAAEAPAPREGRGCTAVAGDDGSAPPPRRHHHRHTHHHVVQHLQRYSSCSASLEQQR